MKLYLLLLFLILSRTTIFAQTDSSAVEPIPIPEAEYVIFRYGQTLQTDIPIYNYSNKWDLDGDKKNDSLIFIGNGGAHSLFHLKIVLTTDSKTREFPFIELDMPYLNSYKDLKESGANPGVQFVVYDFDSDGIVELYLYIDAPYEQLPKQLKRLGITSRQVLINCSRNKLEIKNFKY